MSRLIWGVVLAMAVAGCGDGAGVAVEGEPEGTPEGAPEVSPEAEPVGQPDAGEPEPTPEPAPESEGEPVVVPLGETLWMAGDDYLADWGADNPAPVEIVEVPEGSAVARGPLGAGGRLTPDVPGEFVLRRAGQRRAIRVREGLLNEDTFLNFNYSPTEPVVVDGDDLWVACPTSNAIQKVILGEGGPAAGPLVPTGSWPTALAVWGDFVLVAQTGRDSLGFVDRARARLVDAIRVGDEPAGVVVDGRDPGRPVAWVALSGEGAVVAVDLLAREVIGRVEVGRDPRAMVLDPAGGRLFVASLVSSNAHPQGARQRQPVPPERQFDIAVIDVGRKERVAWVPAVGTILRGLWLDPGVPGVLAVARSNADNTRAGVDADGRPYQHGISLIDIDPGSDRLYEVVREIDLDRQASSTGPAPSPFTMVRTPDGARMLVTLSASRQVLVLDAARWEEIERWESGHDPRGLVFVGDRVWTLAWLDNAAQSWPWRGDGDRQSVLVGDDPTPESVKEGQRIFNDARFSRHGDFSCNNCHIDGLTDGLVWNILLDGDVNTLAFRNIGGTAPFLWGGFLPTLFDFSREVLRLVGATASGRQMELLTTYMQSVTAPPNPNAAPGGRLTAQGERGREIFVGEVDQGGGGCGDCHSGPLLTNLQRVEGKTPSVTTDVPSLIATYDTGPWGRLGQWETLEEMVAFGAEFTGARLDEEALAALVAYVEQLPGDVIYLNSAVPLNNSRRVPNQTPVSLTFSGLLVEGQEDHFELLFDDGGEGVPVRGGWAISGRRVTFEPVSPLGQDSVFLIRVSAGLRGVLGGVSREPLELRFETGTSPQVDYSGRWRWNIRGLIDASVVVAAIQSTGGHVSGVILESDEAIDFDHVEGYVSGTTLIIDPFLALTDFGQVQVREIEAELFDEDEDGRADGGQGEIRSIIDLDVEMVRLAYPD